MTNPKIKCPVCGKLISCTGPVGNTRLKDHPKKGPRCKGSHVPVYSAHQIDQFRSGRGEVSLREEHDGSDSRYLSASLKPDGSLAIEGQDLGPGTAIVSSDGEYEWTRTILPEHIPQLLALLGAPADAKILEVLAFHWTEDQSHELERRIRESDIPSKMWTWGR